MSAAAIFAITALTLSGAIAFGGFAFAARAAARNAEAMLPHRDVDR